MSKELKQTVLDMGIGILLYGLLLSLLAIPLSSHLGYSLLGLEVGILAGCLLAVVLLLDMAYTAQDSLESRSEAYARKKTMLHGVFRKLAILAVIVLCWNLRWINVLGVAFALLGLKPGAYFAGWLQRWRKRGTRI